CSRLGSFARLQRMVGKRPNEMWSYEDRKTFHAVYSRFLKGFREINKSVLMTKRPEVLPGDAFLYFIE
ncbi:MAG: hypothetical protein LUF92_11145, partial [Clostridiales bacterium]|nr:hypothetical protein [Clostridiales bacterium]